MRINFEHTKKQRIAWHFLMDKVTTEIIFGGGAGGAKSYLGCAWLIIMCLKYPRTRWLLGRKTLKRLKETTLVTFFKVCRDFGLKKNKHFKYNSIDGLITWFNGSEILLKELKLNPSDPDFDELGSLELTGAFVDEVNQIVFKAWEVITSRVGRCLNEEYGLLPKVLGSCNPSKGWVYSEFYRPFKEGVLLAYRMFIQALAKDNKHNSKFYIQQLERIKNKATRERLLNGNWEYDDDPACLFEYTAIQDIFHTNVQKSRWRYITGDVSRKGKDKMILFYWEGLQVKDVKVFEYDEKKNTKVSSEIIMEWARKKNVRRSHIILDEGGVGGGVVDNVEDCTPFDGASKVIQPREAKNDPSKKLKYANLKTQCFFFLADLVEEGEIGIDEKCVTPEQRQEIVEELGYIKQKDIDNEERIELVDKKTLKKELGRSPDWADSLMMRMLPEVRKLFKREYFVINV